ncbi:arginine N-succinyltransferase [Marinobacter zhejiangensis]|uniref:Arginine N-succinyltransferase n=1 Tax=Marinobacter zhejiangensis TaxID=488535 RepID=A0A1I4KT46_9GAMM|nr:arginine N-succinyltransferase [Marinobacter zhejiangensis]SFL81786.1 arginine N-succinyltransferase [Marinobacter zhejiangensis]
MWLVRPAQPEDVDGILQLAADHCSQLSSTIPKSREGLAARIELSCQSFAGERGPDRYQRFLFVLVDSKDNQVQGVAGIDGRAGNGQPFYNYRMDALIHSSHELGVSRRVDVLYPSHALTDRTLLGAFVIAPGLCDSDAFELLSRARMLFMACHRNWFSDRMVVEIQGIQTDAGEVPFWDSLGRHFFDMDFDTADRYSGMLSKTFIAELMPPNPIYVTLLSESAQQALGQAHPATRRTVALLQQEGFHGGNYVDIFDGGPVLEARTNNLKTMVTCQRKQLRSTDAEDGELCLLARGEGLDFRCTLSGVSEALDEVIRAPLTVLHNLECESGCDVMVAPL